MDSVSTADLPQIALLLGLVAVLVAPIVWMTHDPDGAEGFFRRYRLHYVIYVVLIAKMLYDLWSGRWVPFAIIGAILLGIGAYRLATRKAL